jgi:hypothetical protein
MYAHVFYYFLDKLRRIDLAFKSDIQIGLIIRIIKSVKL